MEMDEDEKWDELLLLDGIRVGRSLGCVDKLVGKLFHHEDSKLASR